MYCLLFAVPAIYDVTICSRGDDPGLMDVVNAKPSSADICQVSTNSRNHPEWHNVLVGGERPGRMCVGKRYILSMIYTGHRKPLSLPQTVG